MGKIRDLYGKIKRNLYHDKNKRDLYGKNKRVVWQN